MKARSSIAVVAAASLAFATPVFAQETSAKYVEGRLLAPCCYQQTLDIHESELATELRVEIGGRVARGESAQAIEEDMVSRYGERVRAVPKGSEPRGVVTLVGTLLVVTTLVVLLFLVRRWSRRGATVHPGRRVAPPERNDTLDERLDAELRALDEA
ncbi:MAG: cytochrome c-type biogenesis protein CcmH [Polyangiaceae bacterium]